MWCCRKNTIITSTSLNMSIITIMKVKKYMTMPGCMPMALRIHMSTITSMTITTMNMRTNMNIITTNTAICTTLKKFWIIPICQKQSLTRQRKCFLLLQKQKRRCMAVRWKRFISMK